MARKKYKTYLHRSHSENGDLSEQGDDFWNFAKFTMSAHNQIKFLISVNENKPIVSKQCIAVLKKVLIAEQMAGHKPGSKTGWTRDEENDIGWWVGYRNRRGMNIFSLPGISNCAQFQTLAVVNSKTINREFLKEMSCCGEKPSAL